MSGEHEAYMSPELILRVLEHATPDVVLIGGQALAYWMGHYDIRAKGGTTQAISRDVDFFTRNPANPEPLRQFAEAIGGRAEVTDARVLSALVGSAVAPAGGGRVYNVDLLHNVIGLKRESVEKNAVIVLVPGTRVELRVMHPLDVLQSRNANLHGLAEKQDEAGRLQLQLAIEVARAFLDEQLTTIEQDTAASDHTRHRAVLDVIRSVNRYSTEDAARKNAERYGIFLADAIPAWRIRSAAFWGKQWPHLRKRMSPAYALQCEERASWNVPSAT